MATYQLIDSGGFRKLERVGDFVLIRQALSAVWDPQVSPSEWKKADAEFIRHRDGGGEWRIKNKAIEKPFFITLDGSKFLIKLTGFGHLGLFPEQQANWQSMEKWTREQVLKGREIRALNLFAYTGGSTMFCAKGGAEVAHVDASKGSVKWASENARESGLGSAKIRWLVDDVKEFVAKEVRRQSQYDMVILDPPSYGKGDRKQIWKIEDDLMDLLKQIKRLLTPEGERLVCLSAHSEGYTPISLENQLVAVFGEGEITAAEMVIVDDQGRSLPSGAGAIWRG